jgi:hypothetical protein
MGNKNLLPGKSSGYMLCPTTGAGYMLAMKQVVYLRLIFDQCN